MKRSLCLALVLSLIITGISCSGQTTTPPVITTQSSTPSMTTTIFKIVTDINPPNSGEVIVKPSFDAYQKDSIVNLFASSRNNTIFDHWSGDIKDYTSNIYITMDSDKKVVANFKQLYSLNIKIEPSDSGSVTAESRLYKEGESVVITANPTPGFGFQEWSGDYKGSNKTITVLIDSSKTIQANFVDFPPAEVANLTAKTNAKGILLSWRDPSGLDFKEVEIFRSDLQSSTIVKKGVQSAQITGLEDNRLYTFTVKTIDVSGNKSNGVTIGAVAELVYSSLDYFKITEGWGIKYQVTDDYQSMNLNCSAWVISQYNKNRNNENFDFVFTLTQDKGSGFYANSCLGGYLVRYDNNRTSELTAFKLGNPASNQGQYFYHFSLPEVFKGGDSWSWFNGQFNVDRCEPQTINGITFSDCIKVTANMNETNPFMQGSGYYILAKDVGIVEIAFNRINGTRVSYKYISNQQFSEPEAKAMLDSIKIY
jgi:hypothetical protein